MPSMQSIHPYWLMGASLALAVLPMGIAIMSAYLKISIVFGTLRSALGAQGLPGPIVVMSASLCASLIVMAPTLEESAARLPPLTALDLRSAPDKTALEAIEPAIEPFRAFMLRHSGSREVAAVVELLAVRGVAVEPQSMLVAVPSFLLSELKEAFEMSFVLLLPFLVIDLAVSTVLAALGMYMVSPVLISLPLKLMFFASAEGWLLLTDGLVRSYRVG